MKVGVLCPNKRDFWEFEQDNREWQCYWIHSIENLVGVTVDFYVRLYKWRELPDEVLRTVNVQEKIRNLNKKEKKTTTLATGGLITGTHTGTIIMDDLADASTQWAKIPTLPFWSKTDDLQETKLRDPFDTIQSPAHPMCKPSIGVQSILKMQDSFRSLQSSIIITREQFESVIGLVKGSLSEKNELP